jgi:ketosteroid isomerase-like protein
MIRAVNLAALALAGACGGTQRLATATDDVTVVRDAWTRAFNARQLEPAIATFALDAVVLPITGGRIVSAAAIKNLYARIWDRLTPHVELTSHVIERSGDLAYDSGEYVETVVAGPHAVTIAGGYVFVYRHEPSGWRIAEQVFTEASGAPEAAGRAR